MAGERVPRIRLRSVPGAGALVVRGDELDPVLLAEDASRFHERFPTGAATASQRSKPRTTPRSTSSARPASCASPRSSSSSATALERAGVQIVPTFRRPHVTLCHEALDQLVERLVHCEHRVLRNPYHVAESEE